MSCLSPPLRSFLTLSSPLQTTLSPAITSPAMHPVSAAAAPASPGSVRTNGDPDLEPRMAQLETLEAKVLRN